MALQTMECHFFYNFADCFQRQKKGMDVTLSTKEFMELQQCTTAKDIEIVRLKEQIAQSEAERDLWKSHALNAEADDWTCPTVPNFPSGCLVFCINFVSSKHRSLTSYNSQ